MKSIVTSIMLIVILNASYAQELISIHGNDIQYEIKGSGEPWIILVNGSGMDMHSMDTIFRDLSKITTVVRYSRAGLGNSTFPPQSKDFNSMVGELEQLVEGLAVPGPFILGGHSFGGLIVKAFAGKNPSLVSGLLSLDPSFEDNWAVLEPFEPEIRKMYQTPLNNIQQRFPERGFTHEFKTMVDVYDSPDRWQSWFEYSSSIPHFVVTSLQTTDAVNSPGRSTKEVMMARASAQYRSIARSEIHMQIQISDAGHLIYDDQPQMVVDAFRMLYNLVK